MLLRIQSSEGIKRIELNSNDSVLILLDKIKAIFNLNKSIKLFKDKTRKNEIKPTITKTITQIGLKHGDMLYLEISSSEHNNKNVNVGASTSKVSNCDIIIKSNKQPQLIKEDDVDLELWKSDGLIERKQDPVLCKHGTKAKCINCMPLEPFDEKYLLKNNIKVLSFHSYLRKQTRGIDNGKFAILENISCKIKDGCSGHSPWPKGICTKCQPTAVTLNRQTYRHVDNVIFENASIVEQFINYWRATGHQRVGFLYGNYEQHKGVPLGIKANIVAIYEPPQESSANFVRLVLPDKNKKVVEELASKLGFKTVGWIFTDLISQDATKGTVKYLRNVDTYFLTAQECIMAAHYQTIYQNACRLSSEGYFGSKFVTVVITGDKENQIHMEAYQVSNQCMALVRDNCLIPTKNSPRLAYVKKTTKEQYVPDVFFTEKDKFNNEIKQVARFLPIDYLLIDMPVSMPKEQKFTFNLNQKLKPFAIENRMIQGYLQDFHSLSNYLKQFDKKDFHIAIKDFHLLIYLATMDMICFKNDINKLLEVLNCNDNKAIIEWSKNENWATLEQLIEAQNGTSTTQVTTSNQISNENTLNSNNWSCQHCTFDNTTTNNNCEICSLPRHF